MEPDLSAKIQELRDRKQIRLCLLKYYRVDYFDRELILQAFHRDCLAADAVGAGCHPEDA